MPSSHRSPVSDTIAAAPGILLLERLHTDAIESRLASVGDTLGVTLRDFFSYELPRVATQERAHHYRLPPRRNPPGTRSGEPLPRGATRGVRLRRPLRRTPHLAYFSVSNFLPQASPDDDPRRAEHALGLLAAYSVPRIPRRGSAGAEAFRNRMCTRWPLSATRRSTRLSQRPGEARLQAPGATSGGLASTCPQTPGTSRRSLACLVSLHPIFQPLVLLNTASTSHIILLSMKMFRSNFGSSVSTTLISARNRPQ